MSVRIGPFEPLQLVFGVMNTLMAKGIVSFAEATEIIRSSLPPDMPDEQKTALLNSIVQPSPSPSPSPSEPPEGGDTVMSKSTGQINTAAGLEAVRDEMAKQGNQIANQGTQLDVLKWLMVGLVVVLLLGLGGIIQSYLANKTSSYLELTTEIQKQSHKIDLLTNQVKELKR